MQKAHVRVHERWSKNLGKKIPLLLCSVLFLYPMYWMICLSFKSESEASARPFSLPTTFNLENYREALKTVDLATGLKNSLIYSIVVATLVVALSGLAAYAIFRMRRQSSGRVYQYFILGMAVPGMCLVVPVFMILKSIGLIGTMWAVVIPCVTGNLSAAILLLGAFMKTLPRELEEAAAMDGCGPFRGFCSIVLPIIRPALLTKFILVFLNIWNEYGIFKIFCLGKSMQPLTLMVAKYFNSQFAIPWGNVGAAIVMSSLPAIIVYSIFSKQIANAMTVGSLSK